jgi:nitrogen fixation protein
MLGLWEVTAHLGGGALLLANTWLLWLSTRAEAIPAPSAQAVLVEARS